MATLFLVVLFAGLALGSLVMWRGVERYDPRKPATDTFGRELPAPPVGLLFPVGASALLSFGAVGYQILRHSALGSLAALSFSFLAGAVGATGAKLLVSRWAVPAALRSPEDPRFSLQGFPGVVVAGIDAADQGEVTYEANGRSVTIRARSLDGNGIPAGDEIAIDRLEDGVAYVERWSHVEERL